MSKKEKDPKPRTRRKKVKYPNLNPAYNLKSRSEEIHDVASYADQLNKKEKEFLNKFMGEWVGADLDYKDLKKNLHNTQELKKLCTDRNNSRNRDIYFRARMRGELISLTDLEIDRIRQEESLPSEELDDLNNNQEKSTDPGDSTGDT